MPTNNNISRELYFATYQGFDGSNTTLGMVNANVKLKPKLDLSVGAGVTTDFKNSHGLIFEGKSKYNFDSNNSLQLRVRSTFAGEKSATQFRLAPGCKENLGKTTSVYINPYVSAKINHNSGKWTTDVGVFGGVTQKIGKNISISAELQRYDLVHYEDNSSKNWGVNVMLSYKF